MNNYDILVVGGGTAGCACAYTAAKYGLKVLLIEQNSFLGGSITSSLVIPAMNISKNAINTEFYNTLYSELEKLDGAVTYQDGNKGWFNPELTKIVLDKMLSDVKVDIIFDSYVDSIKDELLSYIVTIGANNLRYYSKELLPSIETNSIVDATGDAIICHMLNCEFLNDSNDSQPKSLRFIMSGVNTNLFSKWIMEYDSDRDVTTSCSKGNNVMFSTAYTWDNSKKWALAPLFRDAIAANIITEEDSNYFQIFTVAGTQDSVAFNCPRLVDEKLSLTEAYIKGRESILRLSQFCKKYLPGFKNSYISSIANSLGIRVSRRVKGKYVYTKDDLLQGKTFDNPVVVSNYPIDIHSKDQNSSTLAEVEREYQLPVESLIVKNNLFVIGRCISAEFEAQAALRVIPSCFSMGEGLAKYLAEVVFP